MSIFFNIIKIMIMQNSIKTYTKDLLQIATPIILGNLGFILISVGDVIVAGRHSTDTLAAISLATAIINCITIMGIGILGSISPILSNYRGEKKEPEKYFYPSLAFAFLLSLIISFIILGIIPFIDLLGFESHFASTSKIVTGDNSPVAIGNNITQSIVSQKKKPKRSNR
jgi:MATE family multidrug resistance protein